MHDSQWGELPLAHGTSHVVFQPSHWADWTLTLARVAGRVAAILRRMNRFNLCFNSSIIDLQRGFVRTPWTHLLRAWEYFHRWLHAQSIQAFSSDVHNFSLVIKTITSHDQFKPIRITEKLLLNYEMQQKSWANYLSFQIQLSSNLNNWHQTKRVLDKFTRSGFNNHSFLQHCLLCHLAMQGQENTSMHTTYESLDYNSCSTCPLFERSSHNINICIYRYMAKNCGAEMAWMLPVLPT